MHVSELCSPVHQRVKRSPDFTQENLPSSKRHASYDIKAKGHSYSIDRLTDNRTDNRPLQINLVTNSRRLSIIADVSDKEEDIPMPCATVDRRRTARRFIPIDSQLPPPPPRMASGSTILLEDARLWSQFHSVGNEMIITKNGRCLFPTLRFRPIKLDPKALYSIAVDIVQAVPHKFKFNKSGIWMPVPHDSHGMGEADDDELLPKCTPFVHPGAPQTGAYWQTHGASFPKLKLTNRYNPPSCSQSTSSPPSLPEGHFYLHSFHQYQPRVHLIKHTPQGQKVTTFLFEETKFIAVTHYQNVKVNSLKKCYNPHAKGFKDYETKLAASRIRSTSVSSTISSGTPTTVTVGNRAIPLGVGISRRQSGERKRAPPKRSTRQSRRRWEVTDSDSESDFDNDDELESETVVANEGTIKTEHHDFSNHCGYHDGVQFTCIPQRTSPPPVFESDSATSHHDATLTDSDSDATVVEHDAGGYESPSSASSDSDSSSSIDDDDNDNDDTQNNTITTTNFDTSPLQILSLFCSHILETNSLSIPPTELIYPLTPIPTYTPPSAHDTHLHQKLHYYESENKRLRKIVKDIVSINNVEREVMAKRHY